MEPAESAPPATETVQYEQIRSMVAAEFTIEEGFIEYNTPTFYVTLRPDLKQAFLRLYKQLNSLQLVPVLRKREKIMLQVVPKPPVKPNRPLINLALLVATIGTTLITGYMLSGAMPDPWIGAIMFSAALMSILGAHEMGHKLTANKHRIEATYPYFIPGVPPFLPTFGAVIQQKSLPPNRDALFDLGISGPIVGFMVTILVSIIGMTMSNATFVTELPPGTFQPPLLLEFIADMLIKIPSASNGPFLLIELHPLAYAGYIGMVVTMLNLIPVGQLDGGHIAYVLLGEKNRNLLSFIALAALLFISVPMALIAFLILRVRHPGPLDDISRLSKSRKIATIVPVLIFALSVAPIFSIFQF